MTSFWLGLAAGTVIGVLLSLAAAAVALAWAAFASRGEGEWVPPADW
jgi:hypothetical protein